MRALPVFGSGTRCKMTGGCARLREEHVVVVEQADFVVGERLGPELGERFGVGAIDDDVDVRVRHVELPVVSSW